jgi:hypothetical protein
MGCSTSGRHSGAEPHGVPCHDLSTAGITHIDTDLVRSDRRDTARRAFRRRGRRLAMRCPDRESIERKGQRAICLPSSRSKRAKFPRKVPVSTRAARGIRTGSLYAETYRGAMACMRKRETGNGKCIGNIGSVNVNVDVDHSAHDSDRSTGILSGGVPDPLPLLPQGSNDGSVERQRREMEG